MGKASKVYVGDEEVVRHQKLEALMVQFLDEIVELKAECDALKGKLRRLSESASKQTRPYEGYIFYWTQSNVLYVSLDGTGYPAQVPETLVLGMIGRNSGAREISLTTAAKLNWPVF